MPKKNTNSVFCMGVFSLLSVCFFVCMVTDFSAAEKDIGAWSFARMFDYYPDTKSPILVNFDSRGVTAAALLPGWMALPDSVRRSMAWALGIGGGGVASGRVVGFASCKPADALVYVLFNKIIILRRRPTCRRFCSRLYILLECQVFVVFIFRTYKPVLLFDNKFLF